MRVTFVIHDLSAGGAQRVMALMAGYWADQGWPVCVITLSGPDEHTVINLSNSVQCVSLGVQLESHGIREKVTRNIAKLRALRRAIVACHPEIVISFMDKTNVLVLLATIGLPVPLVISERVDPKEYSIGPIWGALRRVSYLRASALIVQTQRAREYFPPSIRQRATVIPNPVDMPSDSDLTMTRNTKTLVAMGRLVEQKGFDLLIDAFSCLAPSYPDWSLDVWGEGPLRTSLEHEIATLDLCQRVRLCGITGDVARILRQADIFVLPSRFEGFPNVLLEAMACGLPVVTFDCPSGPAELVTHEVNGLLVPRDNVKLLASALDDLMSDESKRERLGREATKSAEIYSLPAIMPRWESALRKIGSDHKFQFGANWVKFLTKVNDERIAMAEQSLRVMLRLDDLKGKRFIDVGSGSGLFSLAACRLGAHVVSFDDDPQSVKCTQELKQRFFDDDSHWQVESGSVLDEEFLGELGTFDVVYAWGVLHHTGDMWRALSNTSDLVAPGGQLFIALANDQGALSTMWTVVKLRYNRASPAGKKVLVLAIAVGWEVRSMIARVVARRNPISLPRWTDAQDRGMSRWHDLVDWVGGFPFEVATAEAICAFYQESDFSFEHMRLDPDHGCNQFVLRRRPNED